MKEFISYGQLEKKLHEVREKIGRIIGLTHRKGDEETTNEIETDLREVLDELTTLEEKVRNTREFEEELYEGGT